MLEIRNHRANDPDFIIQSMPLQEIVFRTLLLVEDQTMTLGDLHYELTERWSSPIRPITVSLPGLARILNSDEFYGFEMTSLLEPEIMEPDLPMLPPGDADDDSLLSDIFSAIASDDGNDEEGDDPVEDEEDDPYEEDDED